MGLVYHSILLLKKSKYFLVLNAIRTAIKGPQQNEAAFFLFLCGRKTALPWKTLGPLLSKKIIEINRRTIFFIE